MPINTTTIQLAKLLGVMDYPNVKDFTLTCSADDAPQLVITQYVRNVNAPPQLHERLFDLVERTTMPTPEPAPVPPQIDIARMALHAKFRVYDTIDEATNYHRNAYRRNNRIRWALVMGAPISPIDLDGTHKDLGGMETVPAEALINFRKATA